MSDTSVFRISVSGWLAILLMAGMTACSSLQKKAEADFQAGAYEEAIATYDQILAKDPTDSDAVAGRLKARQKLIDTKLIEVRRTRMAGNEQNGIDILNHLVTLEDKWGYYPGGPVAYTQEEESGEAMRFLDGEVASALKQSFPLRASYLLTHYGKIFQGDLAGAYGRAVALVRTSGRRGCEQIATGTGPAKPYFDEFVQRYCAHWGVTPAKLSVAGRRKLKQLYRSISSRIQIEGLPAELTPVVAQDLEQAFEQTPWFDVNGSLVLPVTVSGKFDKQRTEVPENRVYSYTVQVPYTDYEPVEKQHDVPYTEYQYLCNGGTCANTPITKYRSESYWDNEPVIRYRDDPRTQPYSGTRISQVLQLTAAGKARFVSGEEPFSLVDKSEMSGFESQWNLPDIGLKPEHANVPDSLAWLKAQASRLGTRLNVAANRLWEDEYCQPSEGAASLASSGEQVHRCLRGKPSQIPKFVSLWYQDHLGVSVSQADDILGLKDL